MSARHGSRTSRVGTAAALFLVIALVFSGSAAGQEPYSDLQARVDSIQGRFDANAKKVEKLRFETARLRREIARLESRAIDLRKQRTSLMDNVTRRPSDLHGPDANVSPDVVARSEDLGELIDGRDFLARVSMRDAALLVKLAKAEAELEILEAVLEAREKELERDTKLLEKASKRLQKQFRSIATESQRLRRTAAESDAGGNGGAAVGPGGMPCPVGGPVSFVDTWGAPRAGHSHQGVDMMSDYGTPVIAVVSGTASYVTYHEAGGNMIYLSGVDGNDYYYIHNQVNLVAEGDRIEVGQKIATVGDTGNASGSPHLHFEFHPGRGGAVNPYPLVASLCK